jgi:(S)-2-hydroxyglutarate dehydrogenase
VANKNYYDYLVIGAGIMGLSAAFHLHKKFPKAKIMVLEKEREVGLHASGRNSGVIHAGIYYANDSLKARFCLKGGNELKKFCYENKLQVNECGKVIVAKDERELTHLKRLYQRGCDNGASLEWINSHQLSKIEPLAKTHGFAIWSPKTAAVSPYDVCTTLKKALMNSGIDFRFNAKVTDINPAANCVTISTGDNYTYGIMINCAGLYADKIAQQYGLAQNVVMLPFKGRYMIDAQALLPLKTNVYPVPDEDYPFLGLHFTKTVCGKTKFGPTAIPALWRENYDSNKNFSWSEMKEIIFWYFSSWIYNRFSFRKLAYKEVRYLLKQLLIKDVGELLNYPIKKLHIKKSPAGIRAQLYDNKNHQLVNDFIFQKTNSSMHVLNAVSPGFTSAFSIAEYIVEELNG